MKKTEKLCSQCGSFLYEVEQITKTLGNSKFPMSVTTYVCSDKECQKRKDDKKQAELEVRLDREEKARERLAQKASKNP